MRRLALLALGCLLAPACAGGGAEAPAGEAIRFLAEDGVELAGEVRGTGGAVVILAHAFPDDRTAWGDFAATLADEGYRALAFDFRGYGDSGGEKDIAQIWRDVLAAEDAMRERGADTVVLVGASMGGTASLIAASQAEMDGVVALSAPPSFEGLSAPPEVVAAVDEPKLFIAAEGDGSAAESAQSFYDQASGAKRVEIVTGDEHGTDLLEGGRAELVRKLILQFLATNA